MDDEKLNDTSPLDNEVKEESELDSEKTHEEEAPVVSEQQNNDAAEVKSETTTETKTESNKEVKPETKKSKKTEAKPDIKKVTKREAQIESNTGDESFPISFKTMALIVVAVIVLILVLGVALHPFFRLKNFEITGNRVISSDEMIDITGLTYGTHLLGNVSGDIFDILSLHYGKLEDKLMERYPYISDIDIRVSFPSTVVINITEREKVACIRTPDGYAAVDAEGIVIELSSDANNNVQPVICGLDITSAVMGERIGITDEITYQRMIIVLGAVLAADLNSGNTNYSFFANLKELRILPSGYYFLTVDLPEGSVLQVKLKEIDTITEKMSWLLYAIEGGSFADLPDGVLDMTAEEAIYRAYD